MNIINSGYQHNARQNLQHRVVLPTVLCWFLSIILVLYSLSTSAANVELSGDKHPLSQDLLGYNINLWDQGPSFNDAEFRMTVGRLAPAIMRYPGGTTANYWNWETGNIIDGLPDKYPRKYPTNTQNTISQFVAGLPQGSEVVYVLNMARPTESMSYTIQDSIKDPYNRRFLDEKIENFIAAIKEFDKTRVRLKYIEFGNEFYIGAAGGIDTQGAIYSGKPGLYREHSKIIAQRIREAFPGREFIFAIQGAPQGDDQREEGRATHPWADDINAAKERGDLEEFDAITYHWYAGPVGGPPLDQGANSQGSKRASERELVQVLRFTQDNLRDDKLSFISDDFDIWVTEYATFRFPDPNPVKSTWVNGLTAALLTAEFAALDTRVKMLNLHALSELNPQWATLASKGTLNGNGLAMSAVSLALSGKTSLETLSFPGINQKQFYFGQDNNTKLTKKKPVIGYRLSDSDEYAILLFNISSDSIKDLNATDILTGNGRVQRMHWYSKQPWKKDLNEFNGSIDYLFQDNSEKTFDLPPFSITVLKQPKWNLIKNASFEQDSSFWQLSEKAQIVSSRKDSATGYRSLKLDAQSGEWQNASQTVAIEGGYQYRVRSNITTRLSQGQARIKTSFIDEDGIEVGNPGFSTSFKNNSGRAISEAIINAPATATRMRITLQLANADGTAWFDDVLARRLGKAPESTKKPDAPPSNDSCDEIEILSGKLYRLRDIWRDNYLSSYAPDDSKVASYAFNSNWRSLRWRFIRNDAGFAIQNDWTGRYLSDDSTRKLRDAVLANQSTANWNLKPVACNTFRIESLSSGDQLLASDQREGIARMTSANPNFQSQEFVLEAVPEYCERVDLSKSEPVAFRDLWRDRLLHASDLSEGAKVFSYDVVSDWWSQHWLLNTKGRVASIQNRWTKRYLVDPIGRVNRTAELRASLKENASKWELIEKDCNVYQLVNTTSGDALLANSFNSEDVRLSPINNRYRSQLFEITRVRE